MRHRSPIRSIPAGVAALLLLLGAARAADLGGQTRSLEGTLTVRKLKKVPFDPQDGVFPVALVLAFLAPPPPVTGHGAGVVQFSDPGTGQAVATAPLGWRARGGARVTLTLATTSFGNALGVYLERLVGNPAAVTIGKVAASGRSADSTGPLSVKVRAKGIVSFSGGPDVKFSIRIAAAE